MIYWKIDSKQNLKGIHHKFFDSSNRVGEIVKKVNFSLSKIHHYTRSKPPDFCCFRSIWNMHVYASVQLHFIIVSLM